MIRAVQACDSRAYGHVATKRLRASERQPRCESRRAGTERLPIDPTMRRVVPCRAKQKQAASASEMNRFETEILTTRRNLKSLMDLPEKWIDRVRQRRALGKLILDLNSSVSETYGRRERWN